MQNISFFSKFSPKRLDNFCKKNIDWIKVRFSAQAKQILVLQAKYLRRFL